MRARPVRLVQISDTHLFADPAGKFGGVTTLASLERVLAHAWNTDRPFDAVLVTGDIAHDGSREAYAAFRKTLTERQLPVYCLPGNHDDPAHLAEVLATGNVRRAEAALLDDWQIIMLDTHVRGHDGGRLGAERLGRLEAELERGRGHHVIVALHHHPVPMGSEWLDGMGLADAADFFAVVDRFPTVRAIVWGHVHQEFESERNGVRLLAAPSTCVQFRPGTERYVKDKRAPGYRWLELRPDGEIATAVRRITLT